MNEIYVTLPLKSKYLIQAIIHKIYGLKGRLLQSYSFCMQIERRLINHYKRWNIELDEEEEYRKFKNRLVEVLSKLFGNYLTVTSEVDKAFLQIVKIDEADEPCIEKSSPIYKERKLPKRTSSLFPTASILDYFPEEFKPREIESWTNRGFGDTNVYRAINNCQNIQELAKAVQCLLWALEDRYVDVQSQLSELVKEIKRIGILTPSVSFSIYKRDKKFTVYPKGDPFLDQGIVDFTLSGLEKYPESAKPFEKALKLYQDNDVEHYRELLDNLRFSLEQFLKAVFNNEKSLENQNNKLLPWLKDRGLHKQTRNLYQTLLARYCSYQNNAVKHKEDFSADEVEFMIYLTGNFMRLILKLSNK